MTDVAELVAELRRAPLSSAAVLMRALGLGSQATLSRLVTRAGEAIVPIGKARARRYLREATDFELLPAAELLGV